ncbi:MAG: hypothetical protein M2R46_00157 [Verrucomicrobia subdivision 3 bacterium]|nr:hypothetical protein [Limisphaerales bacterium]
MIAFNAFLIFFATASVLRCYVLMVRYFLAGHGVPSDLEAARKKRMLRETRSWL